MARVSAFSSPLLLGFDEIERALDRLTKGGGDGYPPYNIERVPADDDNGDILRITLAVAGFSEADLEIESKENTLLVKGEQPAEDKDAGEILFRGIAARKSRGSFGTYRPTCCRNSSKGRASVWSLCLCFCFWCGCLTSFFAVALALLF